MSEGGKSFIKENMDNNVECCRDKEEWGIKKGDEHNIFYVRNSGSSKVGAGVVKGKELMDSEEIVSYGLCFVTNFLILNEVSLYSQQSGKNLEIWISQVMMQM